MADVQSLVLGIDVGGTKIAAGLAAGDGQLLGLLEVETPNPPRTGPVIAAIVELAARLLAEAGRGVGELTGVGLAFPADFDPATGLLLTAPNLPPFVGQDPRALLAAALAARFGASPPVVAGNDAAAAALAEARWGAGRGSSRMLYLTVSTGVGGARWDGETAVNLEPGLRTFPDLTRPNRSLDDLAGGAGLAREARHRLAAEGAAAAPVLWRQLGLEGAGPDHVAAVLQNLGVRELAAAAEAGDEFSARLLRRAAELVAVGVARLLAQGAGDERVVIGGSIALKAPGFFHHLRTHLARLAADGSPLPPGFEPARDVLPAGLGDERGVFGAALFVRP